MWQGGNIQEQTFEMGWSNENVDILGLSAFLKAETCLKYDV